MLDFTNTKKRKCPTCNEVYKYLACMKKECQDIRMEKNEKEWNQEQAIRNNEDVHI